MIILITKKKKKMGFFFFYIYHGFIFFKFGVINLILVKLRNAENLIPVLRWILVGFSNNK
jgi:hypothetical protein